MNSERGLKPQVICFHCGNENGVILTIVLIFVVILALVGATAVVMTTTDTKISANYKASGKVLYVAEAGVQEALYRLSLFNDNTEVPPYGSMITVNELIDDNAHIDIDPNDLLTNTTDDDENGLTDDIGDLNFNDAYDNRTWKTKIMLASSTPDGLVDNTTVYTNTIQPSGNWLKYSNDSEDGTELTIEFRKDSGDMDDDGNTDEIVFYDASLSNPYNVQTVTTPPSGQPVLLITATGRSEESARKLQVQAIRQPVSITKKAALVVETAPFIDGFASISGFNHHISTSTADKPANPNQWIDRSDLGFLANGNDNHGGPEGFDYASGTYNDNDSSTGLLAGTQAAPDNEEELASEAVLPYGDKVKSTGGHLPGIFTVTGTVATDGKAHIFGGDETATDDTRYWKVEGGTGYTGPAQALGVDQDTFNDILSKANVTKDDMDGAGKLDAPPKGLVYIDNANGDTLVINASTPEYDQGWGFMYITGNANFQQLAFKGLIYVEGDVMVGQSFWLLGSMIIKGATTTAFGDDILFKGTFLYSEDAIDYYVTQAMSYRILSWKEVLGDE